ncbi:unnamed protein product [Linum tenue]|uniref:General transcription and DNA repair factor IIH subunit TFB4 n=1 Tax=Linum tenue TaxID=586396 RepID=A0AAV0MH14_9ROSI|nr:unnamed protein product [Linum tenue]
MASLPSKQISDDVSLLVVLIDTNPFFWSTSLSSLNFHQFVSHLLVFLDLIVLLSQLNQIVVIAAGHYSCDYIYDSSLDTNQVSREGELPTLYSFVLQRLEEFVSKDENSGAKKAAFPEKRVSSLLSGSLSMPLCCIFSL